MYHPYNYLGCQVYVQCPITTKQPCRRVNDNVVYFVIPPVNQYYRKLTCRSRGQLLMPAKVAISVRVCEWGVHILLCSGFVPCDPAMSSLTGVGRL